jgi:hypothetical protein
MTDSQPYEEIDLSNMASIIPPKKVSKHVLGNQRKSNERAKNKVAKASRKKNYK